MSWAEAPDAARTSDRILIADLMARWTRLLDRADWDAIDDVFHPDGSDEHGLFRGSIENLRAWLKERAPAIEQSFHQIGQVIVDFVGPDLATAETYVLARFR